MSYFKSDQFPHLSPAKKAWITAKLIYLDLAYFLAGLDDEYYHHLKGNYCTKLGWYHRAASNYRKALKESQNPSIHSMLGFCLLRLGEFGESVQHFRVAYEKIPEPDVALGLAITEYEISYCR